jgi:hypothetical protein
MGRIPEWENTKQSVGYAFGYRGRRKFGHNNRKEKKSVGKAEEKEKKKTKVALPALSKELRFLPPNYLKLRFRACNHGNEEGSTFQYINLASCQSK